MMKRLTVKDLKKIYELHSIYSYDIPNFMYEIMQVKEMKRLKNIGQNCGRDYISNKLQTFDYNYSRFEHSIGVGLIIWNFTKDIKQTIAGMLHDIATPTFSHVIDYYNNDAKTQTSTELSTEEIIRDSKEINIILKKYNIKLEEVSNYSLYPIADNDIPQLSADRLEYNLYMGTARGIVTIDEAKTLYNNIIIAKNEYGFNELCFKNIEMAKVMTNVALDNGKFMSGGVSSITNEFLSDILKLSITEGILKPEMFMKQKEEDIIQILNNTENKKVSEQWKKFKTFDIVYESKAKIKDKYSIKSNGKKRYINPLVKIKNNIYRTADIDKDINDKLVDFLNQQELYYSI